MQANSTIQPETAIILAAGFGKRMRPITATTPKPLIRVAGRVMLDVALERYRDVGVKTCVVNVHYLADLVAIHAENFEGVDIVISDEREELLETGGGINKALPMLGEQPFFTTNSDSFWLEGVRPNLEIMREAWDDETMDMLLLLAPTVNSVGYDGKGDFSIDGHGRLTRRVGAEVSAYAYSGTALIHPRVFKDVPEGAFSLNLLFDRAIHEGRLYGVEGDGLWLHVGTPEALKDAERAVAASAN
ncbi:nucleotidyltransferase family protein [Flexibacterium corallicola]|uniref:nucleotidyltransferase family protein n=1 Tax=Flexibacterium corallicola TaxID=3037259 RepID=UPI00286F6FD1|nr:nucleotidyltransferase family protein [Pseudovibrio sp. M1P-2-3]